MTRKLLNYALLVMLFGPFLSAAALAQGTLTGEVIDGNTGESLPGANVFIVELERGTSTDVDGEYTISDIPVGTYTVNVSYIGYEELETMVEVGSGTNNQDFELGTGTLGLDEVVVTAFGLEKERRSLGYSVSSLEGDEVSESGESNLVNALAGKVAGVSINSASGQPGAASRITIRGNSSFLGNNQPLFVVDGVPISNAEDSWGGQDATELFTGGATNRGLDIDPSNIEEMSVLKGASATALYGSRASNGAIIITTKSGEMNQAGPTVTFNSRVGWDDAIIDGYQTDYTQGTQGYFYNGFASNRGGYNNNPNSTSNTGQTSLSWGPHKDSLTAQQSPQLINDLQDIGFLNENANSVPTYNPRKDFYRTGTIMENSLTISGGGSNSNYYVNFGNLDQEGIVPGTELRKTNIMAKAQANLSDNFSSRTSIHFVNTENKQLSEGNGTSQFNFGLINTPISFNVEDQQFEDGTQKMYHPAFNNPNWISDNNNFSSSNDRFIANQQLQWDPISWLTLSERIGLDTYVDTRKKRTNIGTRGEPNGSMFDQKIQRSEINSDFTANAIFDLNEDIGLDAMIGNNINSRYYKQEFIEGTGLNIPDFFNVSNANTVTAEERKELRHLVSLYGQFVFDYRDYLFLTLTARNDWSSTLPEDNRSYFYPSAAVGFVFSEALDIPTDLLSFGKIRASWAQIGSDAPIYSTSTSYVQSDPQDGVRGVINYPFNGVNGYRLSTTLGNPTLKPEITTEVELGTDLRFFDERLSLDAAYYTRTTTDQIFQVPVSSATGYNTKLSNAGELTNEGWEFSLNATPVATRNFRWRINGSWSKNTTTVDKLAEGVDNIFLGGFASASIRIVPEEDGYGAIRAIGWQRDDQGNLVINPNTGVPLTTNQPETIGNVQPDWTASAGTRLTYKGAYANVLFDISQGGDIYNMDRFYTSYYGTAEATANRGSEYVYDGVLADANGNPTDQQNDIAVTRDQAFYQFNYSSQYENFVEDGSYIKLRELTIGYRLPTSILGDTPIKSLNISATGRNLWIKTDFSYGDPEGSLYGSGNAQGFYHAVTPGTRSYHINLRLSI